MVGLEVKILIKHRGETGMACQFSQLKFIKDGIELEETSLTRAQDWALLGFCSIYGEGCVHI